MVSLVVLMQEATNLGSVPHHAVHHLPASLITESGTGGGCWAVAIHPLGTPSHPSLQHERLLLRDDHAPTTTCFSRSAKILPRSSPAVAFSFTPAETRLLRRTPSPSPPQTGRGLVFRLRQGSRIRGGGCAAPAFSYSSETETSIFSTASA